MTRIIVKKLVWNDRNLEHIKKHHVTREEGEDVGKNFIAHKIGKKGRYIVIGRSGTRLLSLVLSRKGPGVYYVVTARDSSMKERRQIYGKENI